MFVPLKRHQLPVQSSSSNCNFAVCSEFTSPSGKSISFRGDENEFHSNCERHTRNLLCGRRKSNELAASLCIQISPPDTRRKVQFMVVFVSHLNWKTNRLFGFCGWGGCFARDGFLLGRLESQQIQHKARRDAWCSGSQSFARGTCLNLKILENSAKELWLASLAWRLYLLSKVHQTTFELHCLPLTRPSTQTSIHWKLINALQAAQPHSQAFL